MDRIATTLIRDPRGEEPEEILKLMDNPAPADRALVIKAYDFCAAAHAGQRRRSGDPYLVHLVETAKDLARFGMGPKTIAAGLLHDSVEDVGISLQAIEKEFGKEVAFLVDGVTKLGQLKYKGSERHVESLRKLLVATSKDVRVLIIKLMDRLHNMRTLAYVQPEKRRRIALETLDIYAAIAHRLGIGVVRRELEDLAFEHAYPEEFTAAKKLVFEREKETHARLEEMTRKLRRAFADAGIKSFETDYRVKGLYSLWQKIQRKGGDVEKVYDIAALRVVVDTVADCYRALGVAHELWQPLPNKIKDYIAFPKPNGYQSLHTTVFAGDGGIVEIQIRTRQMHEEAQFGIASHVAYKNRIPGADTDSGGRQSSFDWIKSLIPRFNRTQPAEQESQENDNKPDANNKRYAGVRGTPQWLTELSDNDSDPDFETSLKTDLFSHRVFVFTPHGDVVDLPLNATPIDFAYAIHSDVGSHTSGARVNGKMVPLDTVLKNGDIVEIETRKSARPSAKWLTIAKTTMAKRHIRSTLEKDKGGL